MSGEPLVSVIMPVRDDEAAVGAAVHSVLGQSMGELELIVLDGRSRDGTADVVRAIAQADPRVRLLTNHHRTIPYGLNLGLSQARGAYVARCDAHATISRTYLERGLAVLDEQPRVAGVGGSRTGVAARRSGVAVATALGSRFGVGDAVYHYSDQAQLTDHATFGVYRAEALQQVGGWDRSLPVNEDVDLDHRVRAAGWQIAYEPLMEVRWHVRESLRDFGRQYRRYGRGKAAMVRKNGRAAVRVRHLAPPALVLTLTAAGIAAAAGWWWAAALLGLPYLAALLVAALWVRVGSGGVYEPVHLMRGPRRPRRRRAGTPRLVGAFAVMHLGWGMGFLEGMLLHLPPAHASGRMSRTARHRPQLRLTSRH
jgi:succinoglycan biosynthesis protein ExoA